MLPRLLGCIFVGWIVEAGGFPVGGADLQAGEGFGFSRRANLIGTSEETPSPSDSPGPPPETASPSKSDSSDRTVGLSTLCCVLAVILFTVIFEKGREALKEAAEEGPFEPVLNTLFGELTILGFIGLVAFLITNPKVAYCHAEEPPEPPGLHGDPNPDSTAPNCALMAWVSTKIFSDGGEEAAEELPEIFESIHMIIFGNMHVSASDRT